MNLRRGLCVVALFGVLCAREAAAVCRPPALVLHAIGQATSVQLLDLDARALRDPESDDADRDRFLGYHVVRTRTLTAADARAVERFFASGHSYDCPDKLPVVGPDPSHRDVAFLFTSATTFVRSVVHVEEGVIETQYANGAYFIAALPADRKAAWVALDVRLGGRPAVVAPAKAPAHAAKPGGPALKGMPHIAPAPATAPADTARTQ